MNTDLEVSKQGACLEANFALQHQSPLMLYDCLIPAMPSEIKKDKRDIYMERALQNRVNHQREELKIVDWYIDVLEGGNDTREIVKNFSKLKKDHAKLLVEHEKAQLNF